MQRRQLLKAGGAIAAGQGAPAGAIVVDPTPRFEISPYLYMQFMEPLGSTDSSVEAAWDYSADNWRSDFLETARDLAPQVIRWGGLYSRYYKWREGVGPPAARPWARNYVWGGKETNRVGTHEFVALCRHAGAEPLCCINFLGDGDRRFATTPEGDRTGDAREAADWVSYANDPDNAQRRRNGAAEPLNIKLWQIGNETSYGNATFSRDEAIRHTVEFARAMKARDASIRLIGWGDRGGSAGLWAPEMIQRAGEHLDYIAVHMMGQSPRRPDTVLRGQRYQRDPERAWEELLELATAVERRISEVEQAIAFAPARIGIAVTEGHLSMVPHNANPVLLEWLSAAYHARSLNIYQRHGARVRMATIADFEGNRWTVNAILLQTPGRVSYLTPAGSVARLFRRHSGTHGVEVRSAPGDLDIAASRAGNRVWLHVVNLRYRGAVEAALVVDGMRVTGGVAHEIAPQDLRQWVGLDQPEVFRPVERTIAAAPAARWRFPAGSVTAIALDCASEGSTAP